MRKLFFISLIFLSASCFAQPDTTKWLRAFPITDYMVDLNDSTKVVQIIVADDHSVQDKQLGLLQGVYNTTQADTVQKGYGRCHLIKGDYYYFTIGHNASGVAVKPGDILYTFVKRPAIYYGQIPKLASHYIELQDVYNNPFYNIDEVCNKWTEAAEKSLVDSIVKDIRFTGNYFMQNDPSMDKLISSGDYKDQKILTVMAECQPEYVRDFFNYIIVRPRLYAGKKWKIAEVFATWLVNGAPTVIKD